jgi:hypothetical protein
MCWEEDKEEELAAKYRAACLAAVKAAQESVRAPNFVHSCCFDSMAASSEQPRHRIADNERTAAKAARSVTTYRDPHRSKHRAGRPRSNSMPLIRGHKNGCGSISDPTYHLTSKAMPFPTGSWNTQLKDVKQNAQSKQKQYFCSMILFAMVASDRRFGLLT